MNYDDKRLLFDTLQEIVEHFDIRLSNLTTAVDCNRRTLQALKNAPLFNRKLVNSHLARAERSLLRIEEDLKTMDVFEGSALKDVVTDRMRDWLSEDEKQESNGE